MSNQLNMLTEVVLEKIARACKIMPPLGTKNLPTPRPRRSSTKILLLTGEPKLPKKLQK